MAFASSVSKCSAVTSAQLPHARNSSSDQAMGGKEELVRLSALTLGDCGSRTGGIREWEWRNGGSRDEQGAARKEAAQKRELLSHEDFYSGCGNMNVVERNIFLRGRVENHKKEHEN